MKKEIWKKKSDSLRGRREAQGSQQVGGWVGGVGVPGVPCADLTSLALSQSDSVGLCDHAEVIANDVITGSGVCGPFNVQQSTDKPKQRFPT